MRTKSNDNRNDRTGRWCRNLALMTVLSLTLLLSGCEEDGTNITNIDDDPPAVPTGVFTQTGDGFVSVYWNDIYELDLAGYRVYRHDGDDPEYGPYYPLVDVAWDENYDPETLLHWYDDDDVVNGVTYYYAVLSYDDSGNESVLSFETVVDTPRPDADVIVNLYDRFGEYPERSGFDFSLLANGRMAWNEATTDIYVAFEGSVPFVHSARPGIVKIQDYGAVDWDVASYAPEFGYSEIGKIELIAGHCYFVKISEDPDTEVNYAKFQYWGAIDGYVEIDWAYQIDDFNPELKTATGGEPGRAVVDEIVRF